LVRAVAEVELAEARRVAGRLRERLPRVDTETLAAELPEKQRGTAGDGRFVTGSTPGSETALAGTDVESESAD
jgi:tritrans,polycis-undecaprenyl-diphosphate synthase [geranylgeranyl-diphosphate specific]